jgi:hypothetical protein
MTSSASASIGLNRPAATPSADGSTYCSTMSQFIASSSRLRLQPLLYEPTPRQFWTASNPVASAESRSKRDRGGIDKAAKEMRRPARTIIGQSACQLNANERKSNISRSPNPRQVPQAAPDLSASNDHRPTYRQPLGQSLSTPLLKLIAFGWNCFDHRRLFALLARPNVDATAQSY